MRKAIFYPRMALSNLQRNKSTYAPYLLACVISIFTFYTLATINHNGALDNMRGEMVVKLFTSVGQYILGLFCAILIFYTNSFLIKRRKKELGLYSILGMEKHNIAVILFYETLIVSAVALVLGIALGMLLSRLIFLFMLRLLQFPATLDMPISPAAIGITAGFFSIVFLLALVSNLRQVHLANPIDLMASSRQGEKEPKVSWPLTALGLVCIALGYGIALYFRSPVEVLLLFLVAVAFVIIGTYCLFTSGSLLVLKLLRKNKKIYYNPKNFITISGMIYRMKQNAAGLATICILSCMVLVTVSATVSLYAGAEDSLLTQYPSEYTLVFDDMEDGDTLLGSIQDIARQENVELTHLRDYRSAYTVVKAQGKDFISTSASADVGDLTLIAFLSLEDYNRVEGKTEALQPGQALALFTGGAAPVSSVTVNGITYQLTQLDTLMGQKTGAPDISKTITLVVPDMEAIIQAMQAQPDEVKIAFPVESSLRRNLSFDTSGTEEQKEAFLTQLNHHVDNEATTNAYFQYRARENVRQDWYSINGGFMFFGIYFGILFLLAAALIIYYKQLSEGYDDMERFEILQKVGMSQQEVRKTISRQIMIVFFLPLLVAAVHMAVAFWPISRVMVVFGSVNLPLLLISMLVTLLAYALIYLLVFRKTAQAYYRIVRRKSI